MTKKLLLSLCISILSVAASLGQFEKNASYDALESLSKSYAKNNQIDSAIIVLEYALKIFPDEEENANIKLGILYTMAGNTSKAIEILKAGLEKGHFYGLNHKGYDKYFKDNPDFEKLIEIERSLDSISHIEYEVVLPTNYKSNNSYPILFIFHGNWRNIEEAKKSWSSQIMNDKYISIFVQSYAHANSLKFKWLYDDEKTKNEFIEIYDTVMSKYSVDNEKVIFAGMSAGGKIVLDFAFNEIIPMTGIILNCPVVPDGINEQAIKQFVEKNKKIGIITGEKDFALNKQKALIDSINNQKGQYKLTINKDIGHTFAENFSELFDEYLNWVLY